MSPLDHLKPLYWVMDAYATSARKAYVAGPFTSQNDAEEARKASNIADDCDVMPLIRDPRK